MNSILILIHCPSNTGYAITPLEKTFYQMALKLCDGDASRIHFSYPSMSLGPSSALPEDFNQYTTIDTKSTDSAHHHAAAEYIKGHKIDVIFGFDQPVYLPIYKYFRRAGIKHFISYWGAPMSSIFKAPKIWLKQLEVLFRPEGPDHYIFESFGMADTAVLGRGILRRNTSVVHLGIDTEKFCPSPEDRSYVYTQLGIPQTKKIFFYAGHMEPRKGVATIVQAANLLSEAREKEDWFILLFGNKDGEELDYIKRLSTKASENVLFGGYRHDLHLIHRGCYGAIIASTGWDSFPRSGVEMQASGLPLLASNLPGLNESISPNETGYLFPPGDKATLAHLISTLLDQPQLQEKLSQQARHRAVEKFSSQSQIQNLWEVVHKVTNV